MKTTKETLERVITAIADGLVLIGDGVRKSPQALDGEIIQLCGPNDGSVHRGDVFPFSLHGQAKIAGIGRTVYDGHVYYTIKLNYAPGRTK